jgi:hypothetical protein
LGRAAPVPRHHRRAGPFKSTDKSPECTPRLGVLSIEPSQSGCAERDGNAFRRAPHFPDSPATANQLSEGNDESMSVLCTTGITSTL